jgi:hypothetical protein
MRKFEMGYTGRLTEDELFKAVKKDKHDERRLELKDQRYVNFRKSVEIAKACQPYDDIEQMPDFARDLLRQVRRKLEQKECKDVEFFTAVGSYLDSIHGVDAFIEARTKEGKVIRITYDCTINDSKGEYGKADVVFLVPRDGIDKRDNKEEYDAVLSDVVRRSIDKAQEHLQSLVY